MLIRTEMGDGWEDDAEAFIMIPPTHLLRHLVDQLVSHSHGITAQNMLPFILLSTPTCRLTGFA